MTVRFSTRGGQITGVTLKDYTKYAPRGQRDQLIELMDPASARFDMSFYVKNGLNNVKVNTMDYVFRAEPVETAGDARRVTMRLAVAENAWLEYEYLIYNKQAPERDYLVDFNVRLVNMAPQMANQTSIGIDWSNVSYQNEKGFQNENMYTTLAYRFPGESSIEELGMSDGAKSKSVSTAVNWVARSSSRRKTSPAPTWPSIRRLPARSCSRVSPYRWPCPTRRRSKGMISHSTSVPTNMRS